MCSLRMKLRTLGNNVLQNRRFVSYLVLGANRKAKHVSNYIKLQGLSLANCDAWDDAAVTKSSDHHTHILCTMSDEETTAFVSKNSQKLRTKTVISLSPTLCSPLLHNAYPMAVFGEELKELDFYKQIPFILDQDDETPTDNLLPGLTHSTITMPAFERVKLCSAYELTARLAATTFSKLAEMQTKAGISTEQASQSVASMLTSTTKMDQLGTPSSRTTRLMLDSVRFDKSYPVFSAFARAHLPSKQKLTAPGFRLHKTKGTKLSLVVVYDYTMSRMIDESDVDCVVVGDSVAMTCYGSHTTVTATMDALEAHTRGVAAACKNTFVIADLPFLAYHGGHDQAIENVRRLMAAGAEAIKLEGGSEYCIDLARFLVEAGVPVMGHLGLTPQHVHQMGGHKVQGKGVDEAQRLLHCAKELEKAGCFAIVLECIPTSVGKQVSQELIVPTFGAGAGPYTDGQALLLPDILGLNVEFKPKFVKRYMQGFAHARDAVNTFVSEVKSGKFPDAAHSYSG